MSKPLLGYRPSPPQYTPIRSRRRHGLPRWVVRSLYVMILAVVGVFAVSLWAGLRDAREVAFRIQCASRLRQIGMACLAYADQNGGRFPDSIGTLYANASLGPGVFICPLGGATPAAGPTTQATANLLQNSPPAGAPGCCQSYVYVGAGLTGRSPATDVVAYDAPANHRGAGGNVLFADGHVDWYDAQPFNAVVAGARAGPASRPAVSPAW